MKAVMRIWPACIAVIVIAGCGGGIDDEFYKKAVAYEKKAFELNVRSLSRGEYTPEAFRANRENAAREAGFSSPEEAGRILREYMDSPDPRKREIARKVLDTAMEYRRKTEEEIKRYKKKGS